MIRSGRREEGERREEGKRERRRGGGEDGVDKGSNLNSIRHHNRCNSRCFILMQLNLGWGWGGALNLNEANYIPALEGGICSLPEDATDKLE